MTDLNTLLPHVKLHFDVKHPTFEECYAYGYACAQADISEDNNPYPSHSVESEHWMDGWWAGFYGQAPLFELDHDVLSIAEERELDHQAVNDGVYVDIRDGYLTRVLEIAGVIAVSAILGYQVIDLVA